MSLKDDAIEKWGKEKFKEMLKIFVITSTMIELEEDECQEVVEYLTKLETH